MIDKDWYSFEGEDKLLSPALLFYPDRIKENIDNMIRIAGGPERLWPHVKTHKNAEIIRLQMDKGIERFKCSTLSELSLLCRCGAREALLAMQPTRIHLERFLEIESSHPDTRCSTLVDNPQTLAMIAELSKARGRKVNLFLDLNNGMNRTGIEPGEKAAELFEQMVDEPWVQARGLHVYDGHIHDPDAVTRAERCKIGMRPVHEMIERLSERGLHVDAVIAGGSPTFPVHAKDPGLDLSPGTTLLWDAGYGSKYPEMPFKPAAVLFTRVVSKPAPGLICTDLGHKSVASEMSFPRVQLLTPNNCEQVSQSEEHLVLRFGDRDDFEIGDVIYAIPLHVCPTVAKYGHAHTVEEHRISGDWKIQARDHDPGYA